MNIYNKESFVNSKKHISIQRLKQQPRLGSFSQELEKMNKALKELKNSGTFTHLNNKMDEFAKSLPNVSTVLNDMGQVLTSGITEFQSYSAGIGRAQAYQEDFNKTVLTTLKNQNFLEESNKSLNKSFNMSSKAATGFAFNLREIAQDISVGEKKIFEYAKTLKGITGGFIASTRANKDVVNELVKTQTYLQNNIGLSEEQAQDFELYAAGIGKTGAEAVGSIEQLSRALEESTGIDAVQMQSQIIQDIASMGADLQLQYGGVGNKLEVATMKARLLGTTMEQLHNTGKNMLDIESSIGAEMEYQQLTGRRLLDNQGKSLTNEYRMATITGNSTKQAELMNQFIESEGDNLEKNLFARQKAAQMLGMDESVLAKMIQKRKLLVKLGAEEVMNMSAEDAEAKIADMRAEAVAKGESDKIKQIDELILASDTKTTAEKANDYLESIDAKISNQAIRGIGGADYDNLTPEQKRKKDQEAIAKAQNQINPANFKDSPLVKFADKAAATFSDKEFIKGVGAMGIVADRLDLITTPVKQLAESLPSMVGQPLKDLVSGVGTITRVIKKPKGNTVIDPADPNGKAAGGYISGPGTGTSDSIPARLSDGEYVINAASTKRNRALLDKINNTPIRMANGGPVASNAKMENLLATMVSLMRSSGVMGETPMNARKRI